MKIDVNIEKIFYWLLGLSAAVIPMPGNSLSSISIVLLSICWLFYTPFSQKTVLFQENRTKFFIMIIPFTLAMMGMLYTDNIENGLKNTKLLLPFLVYPLVLFSIPTRLNAYRFVLYCFSFGTLAASVIGIGRAAYYRLNSLGNYFYYERFSELVDKHTTYFSLFIVISCLFLISELIKSKLKWFLGLPVLAFFFFVLYVASARISVVALVIGILIITVMEVKSRLKWLGLMLPFLLIGLYIMPNFQKRFEPNTTEIGEVSDFEFRKDHWKSVLETIEENSLLFGKGTGGHRDFLYRTYEKYKLTSAYEMRYNAHNQYLEMTLDFGIIGLLIFIFMIGYLMFSFVKRKNSLAIAMLTIFIVYFLTESLFQRQDGVVAFSLVISMFCLRYKSSIHL